LGDSISEDLVSYQFVNTIITYLLIPNHIGTHLPLKYSKFQDLFPKGLFPKIIKKEKRMNEFGVGKNKNKNQLSKGQTRKYYW